MWEFALNSTGVTSRSGDSSCQNGKRMRLSGRRSETSKYSVAPRSRNSKS